MKDGERNQDGTHVCCTIIHIYYDNIGREREREREVTKFHERSRYNSLVKLTIKKIFFCCLFFFALEEYKGMQSQKKQK